MKTIFGPSEYRRLRDALSKGKSIQSGEWETFYHPGFAEHVMTAGEGRGLYWCPTTTHVFRAIVEENGPIAGWEIVD